MQTVCLEARIQGLNLQQAQGLSLNLRSSKIKVCHTLFPADKAAENISPNVQFPTDHRGVMLEHMDTTLPLP